MPGIPTKFVIADLVFDAVRSSAGPFADFLDDPASRPFAYLGAIGADWGDFMSTPYLQVRAPVLQFLAGTPPSPASPGTPGIYEDLKSLRDTLETLTEIVNNKDKVKLLSMAGDLSASSGIIDSMEKQLGKVAGLKMYGSPTLFYSKILILGPSHPNNDYSDSPAESC